MNKILEIKFGSHLYGTDTENSDLDLKGIYLPEAREIVLGKIKKTVTTSRPKRENERNTKDDVDIEILSLDQFLKLLLEGQTMALDMLYAPRTMWTYFNSDTMKIWEPIYAHRMRLMNRRLNAFVGYARQQAAKYGQKGFRVHAIRSALEFLKSHPTEMDRIDVLGIPVIEAWVKETNNENIRLTYKENIDGKILPYIEVCGKFIALGVTFKNAKKSVQSRFDAYGQRALLVERNEGIDWKALSHAVRVNSQAEEVLTTGFITFPRPDRELLLLVKTGKLPYNQVAEIIEEGLEKLQKASELSLLPDEPDYEWANNFIFEIYSNIVKG